MCFGIVECRVVDKTRGCGSILSNTCRIFVVFVL